MFFLQNNDPSYTVPAGTMYTNILVTNIQFSVAYKVVSLNLLSSYHRTQYFKVHTLNGFNKLFLKKRLQSFWRLPLFMKMYLLAKKSSSKGPITKSNEMQALNSPLGISKFYHFNNRCLQCHTKALWQYKWYPLCCN